MHLYLILYERGKVILKNWFLKYDNVLQICRTYDLGSRKVKQIWIVSWWLNGCHFDLSWFVWIPSYQLLVFWYVFWNPLWTAWVTSTLKKLAGLAALVKLFWSYPKKSDWTGVWFRSFPVRNRLVNLFFITMPMTKPRWSPRFLKK